MTISNIEVGKVYRNGQNEFVTITNKYDHGMGEQFIQLEDSLGRTYTSAGKFRRDKETVFDLVREIEEGEIASSTPMLVDFRLDNYAALNEYTPHRVIVLQVVAILDTVPEVFHQPEDLMNHISQNPYVRTVSMLDQ